MIITSQGFGHFTQGLNNQDFGVESPRMLLVLDGCSGAKYSEIGTRLFAQLFQRREEWDSLEKFEEHVKSVFEELIQMMEKSYPVQEELESEFIMENLLFTIIACFQTADSYIVKLFGDGYIVTQNKRGMISFLRFYYGKRPPYYAYKYCKGQENTFKEFSFKTFCFDKKEFPHIAIATDGIMPIARGDVREIEKDIIAGDIDYIRMAIAGKRTSFDDDITIGTFGGIQ